MTVDVWFDTDENKGLLAACARRTIRISGIGAIAWGLLNLIFGITAMRQNPINAPILLVAGIMIGAGVLALTRPTRLSLRSGAYKQKTAHAPISHRRQCGYLEPTGPLCPTSHPTPIGQTKTRSFASLPLSRFAFVK